MQLARDLRAGPDCIPARSTNLPEAGAATDDFTRNVYGLLGIPVDAIDMDAVVDGIKAAAARRAPLLLSTPNLDFLRIASEDPAFQESLLSSDLCPADGFPLVWLSRIMGIPVTERVAGSDIFDVLKSASDGSAPLKVFLFGGADGVAAAAAIKLNSCQGGLVCVGSLSPGFGCVDELSTDRIINVINESEADFLVASLGAQKGQAWLIRNRGRLSSPVRAHLGAALNFEAGTLKRAPKALRQWSLEWLWRIKEEPYLWRRYWKDLRFLASLLATRILPLAMLMRRSRHRSIGLELKDSQDRHFFHAYLLGAATAANIQPAIACFRKAVRSGCTVVIHLSECHAIDSRFFGLLLMLRKQLHQRGLSLKIIDARPPIERIFRLNGFKFLLGSERRGGDAG